MPIRPVPPLACASHNPPTSVGFQKCGLAALLVLLASGSAIAQPAPVPPRSSTLIQESAFDAARALYDGGQFPQAIEAFESFREAYPNHPRAPEALFYHAQASLEIGDDLQASALFRRYERLYPHHALTANARLALGRYYYASGQLDRAAAALQEALERPGSPEQNAKTAYYLGLTERDRGNLDAAFSAFERAAASDTPTAAEALYAHGVTALESERYRESAAAFDALRERFPESAAFQRIGLARAEALLHLGEDEALIEELAFRIPALDTLGNQRDRAHLLHGEALLRQGHTDDASRAFNRVSETSPPYGRRATFGLARIDFDTGNVEEAATGFARVRTSTSGESPDNLAHKATYYEGLSLKLLGRIGEAEERLTQVVESRPDGPMADAALLELGLLHYERRRYEEAASTFERLVQDNPSSEIAGEAARMAGEAYSALGRTDQAREAFAQAERMGAATAETESEVAFQNAYASFDAGNYEEAERQLLEVYRNAPADNRSGEALFWAGEAAFRAGRYTQAEDHFIRFLQEFPDHRQADPARYVLAWTHFRKGDYAAAAAGFEEFLSVYERTGETVPYYADALLRLGDSYYSLGRFDEAQRVYDRVPEATSDGQGADYALFQTAQSQNARGEADAALTTLERLLSEYPDSGLLPQALYLRGSIYFNRDAFSEAVAAYSRVVENYPDSPVAPRALLAIGDAHFNAGSYPEAESSYRAILSRYPESSTVPDALDGLRFSLEEQGRAEELEDVAREAEAQAGTPETRSRLALRRAQSELENGNAEAAARQLESLLAEGVPSNIEAEVLFTLGRSYSRLSSHLDAAAAFARLLERTPSSPLAPEAALRRAEALLDGNDAEAAQTAAALFPTEYPDDAERVASALLIESRALRALGRETEADARIERLLSDYPESGAAAEARAGDLPDESDL